jgi:hypothetical protein
VLFLARRKGVFTMKPWEYRKRDGTTGLCAWCMDAQGVPRRAGESHGVCPDHAKAMLAQIGLRVQRDDYNTGTLCRETSTGTSHQVADPAAHPEARQAPTGAGLFSGPAPVLFRAMDSRPTVATAEQQDWFYRARA